MNQERRIERVFRGYEVRIRTAHYSISVHNGLKNMLATFRATGQVDLFKALSEGYDPLEMYRRFLRKELGGVVLVESVTNAKDTMLAWAKLKALTTPRSYRGPIANLFRDHPDATIDQIPEVLLAVKERYSARGQRNSFIQCRKVAGSWTSDTYGQDSALWRAIRNIKPFDHNSHVHTGKARSVWAVFDVVKKMPEPYGMMFLSMCLLGTGTKEYFEDGFTVEPDRWVTVHGQKTDTRTRRTLLVFDNLVTPPNKNPKPLSKALRDIQPDWQLYDARRCFAHWCDMANIPPIRVKSYMGHSAKGMNELYKQHEIDEYLITDADLLRNYVIANKEKENQVSVPKKVPTLTLA